MEFVADLAQHNNFTITAVLEAGFLDMLMYIYISFPALYSRDAEARSQPSPLLEACRITIHVLSDAPEFYECAYSHPVYELWLCNDPTLPIYDQRTLEMVLEARPAVWRSMQTRTHLIKMRVATLWKNSSQGGEMSNEEMIQAAADLIEFTRYVCRLPVASFC